MLMQRARFMHAGSSTQVNSSLVHEPQEQALHAS
jgi:hypothetical protein